ncbi:MAG: hypothetical protein U1E65_24315 [Myxococcota bacterium]
MSALLLAALVANLPPEARALVDTATISGDWLDAIILGEGEMLSLARVQEAAAAHASLYTDEEARAWPLRSRLRGLLPNLEASVGTDADVALRDGSTSFITSEGRGFLARVSGRWSLGELLFSDAEMRAHRESAHRRAAIDVAVDRATELYFDRLEVLILGCSLEAPSLALRARRLDGAIAALTGGLRPENKKGYLKCDERFRYRRGSW